MARFSTGKIALLAGIVGFGIFLGIDATSKGVERVQGYGPETVRPAAQAPAAGTAAVAGAKSQTGGAAAGAQAAQAAVPGKLGPASRPGQIGQPAAAKVQAKPSSALAAPPNDAIRESFINRLSNKIGDALRIGAKLLLKSVVSLFDAIVG